MKVNQKGFGAIEIIILIAVLAAIILIPAISIKKFSSECNEQYKSVLQSAQPKINEFNNIALLGEEPAQKANVQRGGDCVDSQPYVVVNKVYNVTASGGKAVDTFRSSLSKAGYKITSEDFGREGCKLHYKAKARKNDTNIYAVASQKDIKDSSCTDGYPTGISEAHFRSQNIDYAELSLR